MQDLLRHVSRSFYLTLRILPQAVRAQLSLAYLLARAADTVADTQLVEVGRRHHALLRLRHGVQEACEGRMPALPDFGEFAKAYTAVVGRGTPAERMLLENMGSLFNALRGYAAEDRLRICRVLNTITCGQEMDLIRFGAASADHIAALSTGEELDAYTYEVAGCVGEFWTQLCRAHVFPSAPLNDTILLADAVRFGKGLQLVNILRDLPGDLRQGRCYLPEEQLTKHGLKPQDLLDAGTIARFRPLYDHYLVQAEEHLSAGWRYTRSLPFGCVRIRLACAWPILIAIKTVKRLGTGNILDGRYRIKLSRWEVRRLILKSVVLYPWRTAWNHLLKEADRRGKPGN